MERIKDIKRARIGLYSAGLESYWTEYEGLLDCIKEYNYFIYKKLSDYGDVFNFGILDSESRGRAAGEYFVQSNVDIIFCHSATYFTSATVFPAHQICKAPIVILNLQPTDEMNYTETKNRRWLAQCVSCPISEIINAFSRTGIKAHIINGLLGLDKTPEFALSNENTAHRPEAQTAWREIDEWCMAASVKRTLAYSRFGFLGGYCGGMLDMYSDFTILSAQTGIYIEILEMCNLESILRTVTVDEIKNIEKILYEFFDISGNSSSDPLAKAPTNEQLYWSCKVAAAQERLVRNYDLDALTYYYRGRNNYYEEIQSGFPVGHSLLNASGIPCSGEGDIKTALAMKICDTLGKGGSLCEIIAADYNRNTIIMGHDGPFHISVAKTKPILRGMGVYHGRRGSGVNVEAKIAPGQYTILGITQTPSGKIKLIISEGEAINAPTLPNGCTSTHIKFPLTVVEYMDRWFAELPTHHFSLSTGHNKSLFIKVAKLLGMEFAII